MKSMGIIFSNVYDATLGSLTINRTVASLPFGGRYRQIDFILSNMSNSGISKVGIITKYNYRSLMDHLGSCSEWDLNKKNGGVVFLPPFANGNTGVYKGKLEALYTAVGFLDNPNYDYVVLSDSTILCNIDLRKAVKMHKKSGADVTVISNRCKKDFDTVHPLIIDADENGNAKQMYINAKPKENSYVGMGMFIISRQLLFNKVNECYQRGFVHFERDYLQREHNEGNLRVSVYEFDGVVLRNENVSSYYENNMALIDPQIRHGLFKIDSPIYTKVRDEIPSYYDRRSSVCDSLIADGCAIRGSVKKSILFRKVNVEADSVVEGCIIMQGTKVHSGAVLKNVILDKDVVVTPNTHLIGTPTHPIIVNKGETV